jgi:predicted nucleotidyltransferase
MSQLLQEIGEKLAPIFARYDVERAFVFGSVARGEQTRRSDIDLIVIQETDKRFLDRYEGILADIHTALRRGVDLLIYTPTEFEELPRTAFVRRMINDSKVIYERQR